jgi:hypothetical protein
MKSLDELFEDILKQKAPHILLTEEEEEMTGEPDSLEGDASPADKKGKPKKKKEVGPEVSYDDVIAKHIGDATPIDNYEIGKSFKITNQTDLKNYQKLYPITAPKTGKSIDEPGSKGSGNGEIALYWLLKKNHPTIKDSREGSKPDLSATVNGKEVGIEVKAPDGGKQINIGRFGDQLINRQLLSVILGINALFSSTENKKRTPSLDSWNKGEVIEACAQLVKLNDNKSLRDLAGEFDLIGDVYRRIDETIDELREELGDQTEFTAEDLAAAMLLKILKFKLEIKPGWGGYFVSVFYSGEGKYLSVGEPPTIQDFDKTVLLNSITANGAQLKARLEYIYSSKKS